MRKLFLILCATLSVSTLANIQEVDLVLATSSKEDIAKAACLEAEVEYDELKDVKVEGIGFEFVVQKDKKDFSCVVKTTLDSYSTVLSKKKIKEKLTSSHDKSYTECMKLRNRIVNSTVGYVFGDVKFYKAGFLAKKRYICEFNFLVVE